tara:strand:+ start:133 stop:249 length:117 start_codon:yes stop_codon:yes gene_type:complete
MKSSEVIYAFVKKSLEIIFRGLMFKKYFLENLLRFKQI